MFLCSPSKRLCVNCAGLVAVRFQVFCGGLGTGESYLNRVSRMATAQVSHAHIHHKKQSSCPTQCCPLYLGLSHDVAYIFVR